MRVLIIEDESIAADHLRDLLVAIDAHAVVLDQLDSIKSAVLWFEKHENPDLLFLDIQLADGLSFEIFEKTEVTCPVIFTTAYDQYAIKAFKVNSIDYLLKPIVMEDLAEALNKFNKQSSKLKIVSTFDHELLAGLLQGRTKKYKEQFVVKVGDHLKTVKPMEVEMFFSQDKFTYAMTVKDKRFILDFTLDQLEDILDPSHFFRINRKYIISVDSIKDIIAYSNSRLKIALLKNQAQDMVVSRERVRDFKAWLDR